MTTLPPPRASPTAHSSASSLPQTQCSASSSGPSQNPPHPSRAVPGPPSQSSNIALALPSARTSSIRSLTPNTSSRQSAQDTSTTAASSINAQNSPGSGPAPQVISPGTQTVSPNPTASPGTGAHRNHHKLTIVLVEWRWELFTWALGTLAMSLILALLCVYKDKSITSWKSKVQISVVVAIFSQLAQSALIVSVSATIGQAKWSTIQERRSTIDVERVDEAMRGPEGSMKMLVAAISNPRSPDNKRFRT